MENKELEKKEPGKKPQEEKQAEKKEQEKNISAELNEDSLENVAGGLLKPIIL